METGHQAQPSGLPPYIGRYRVLERIGKGAMAMVYAAEDEVMGRRVAVKVMMADLEGEPETRARFYREARVTGQLLHRNIVTVFDLGEDRGRLFIVMELLSGVPLTEFLHRSEAGPLDVKLDLMIQVCAGLQVAHGRSVVHQDIKPSTFFVQADGALKILDFGVARLAASSLTASGFLVGTPDYMSPEQAAGRPVDARSDLFSAAGVFYFMVTGRPPFASPDLPGVLHAVMHADPAPLSNADAPEALRQVLTRALAKNPGERYQAAADFLADLERVRRVLEGESHSPVQAAPQARHNVELAAVAALRSERADLLRIHPSGAEPGDALRCPASGEKRLRLLVDGGLTLALATVADGPLTRMVGLLGRTRFDAGDGLVITPCWMIHTWFMRFPIDVLFIDRNGVVLRAVESLGPFRVASGSPRAQTTIELPAGTLRRVPVAAGMRVRMEPA